MPTRSNSSSVPPLRTLAALLAVLLLPLAATAQKKRKDDEIQKLAKVDPFTKGEAEAMKALGVERYGPFPWADHFSTTDIDKVLGEGRILWMETAHFRIGFNMTTVRLPDDGKEKKAILAECKQLREKWRKLPSRPKRLGPWLQLHLYSQRCEQAYREFAELVGFVEKPAANGGAQSYLGLPDKFLVLLFQKKSDMARYMKRFCNTDADESMRFYHDKTRQMLLAVSVEGMEGFDTEGIHGHVAYALWQNLINGYNGYSFPLPLWFSTGIAHYYSRQVRTKFVNARIKDTESVDRESQNKWVEKVFRRARHEGALIAFDDLNAQQDWEKFGFHAHTQSWSRIDYLMSLDPQKVGLILDKLKSASPAGGDWQAMAKDMSRKMPKLIFQAFEMDPATFDARWREWVLDTYPKRKD